MPTYWKQFFGMVPEGPGTTTSKSKSLWTFAVGLLICAVVYQFIDMKNYQKKIEQELRGIGLIHQANYERLIKERDMAEQKYDSCQGQRISDLFNNITFKDGPNKITITKKKK